MTHLNEKPIHAKPENIGEVVTIQIFDRLDGDELDTDTMIKCVGYLEAYSCTKERFAFRLRGDVTYTRIEYAEKVVEIYLERDLEVLL